MNELIQLLEILVLVLLVVPILQIVADDRFRTIFPHIHAALAIVLLGWLLLILALTVFLPQALLPLALVSIVLLLVSAWRFRAAYGRSQGLPPGSLSPIAAIRGIADRRYFLKQAERHGPIFKFSQISSNVICVVGLARAQKLLRTHEEALVPSAIPFSKQISGGFLRYMDDETYRVYGNVFRKAFSKSVVDVALPVTREVTRRELKNMEEACQSVPNHAVNPEPYLKRIVYAAFVRNLFGILPGTEFDRRLHLRFVQFEKCDLARPLDAGTRQILDGMREILFAQWASLQRARDGEEAVCALTALHAQDEKMPDLTCVDNLLFIWKIAAGNVLGLAEWAILMLGAHPEWIARIRNNGAMTECGKPDILQSVILETLRLAQSEYLYRTIDRDVEYEGFHFPKGWQLRVCVWESHRDENIFSNPNEFNPDRFLEKNFTTAEYSPFGFSKHACNGVPLTMMVCRTILQTLCESYEWSVMGGEPPVRGFRHWKHWHPNADFKIRLYSSNKNTGS